MKKLGKTATKILDHMRRRYGRYGATSAVGRGPEGGWINDGHRETAACRELVAKGYAVLTSQRCWSESYRGYGQTMAEVCIRLPDAEMAEIEAQIAARSRKPDPKLTQIEIEARK